MKDKSKRIVLARTGGIGDVIHTLPLAKYLKKQYPNASIEYLTSGNISMLLKDTCSYIDKAWNYLEPIDLRDVDCFFNLHGSLKFFLFNLFKIRAKKYFHYRKDRNLHAVINFAKTYNSSLSAFDLENKTLFVQGEKELLSKYDLKEGKYVCFVVGVGKERPHRAWTIEKWEELTKVFLSQEKDHRIVYLGGKDELRLIGYLPEIKNRTINLIGELSLVDVIKVISCASCIVSCDTGLLHMASALGVKVIGLYGPTLPERSGPFTINFKIIRAKNCECISKFRDIKKCKKTNELPGYCMNNLSVEEVLSNLPVSSTWQSVIS